MTLSHVCQIGEICCEETKPLIDASEVFAKFCPMCGGALQNGACVNNEYAGCGKKVDLTIDSLAKANKQLADSTEEVVKLTKRKGELEDSVKTLREQVAELSHKLSTSTEVNMRIPLLKERVEALEQTAVRLQTETKGYAVRTNPTLKRMQNTRKT